MELTAFLLIGFGLLTESSSWADGVVVGVFFGLSLLHAEIANNVETVRWRITDDLHVDLSSVWLVAGAVLLNPPLAALLAVAINTYLWARSARVRAPVYRQIFSTAAIALSCLAASGVVRYVTGGRFEVSEPGAGLLALMLAALVFFTVNTGLVAGAIAVSAPQAKVADIVGEWDENLLEFATISLGTLAAVAYIVNPWLVLFVFPPLLVLHRAVLVRHLELAASTDSKTGLLNAAAWHTQAERELQRGSRRVGPKAVLVVDLDRFKAVNDTHGHLAGDRVLAAVADAMRAEVRDRDLVGRFGGEEFVVLLRGLDEAGEGQVELAAVAERIRSRIASLCVEMPTADGPLSIAGLSASVGGSLFPGDGQDLRTLLQVADTALYAAKRAGRNVVRMGMHLPVAAEVDHEAVDSAR
ncbi:GGDEF domain-containing protein [Pseudonocardia sp.]|uniref:GGDEF domain-containing protein n=1 Tax=Pseudonocardia sp. TaxID=60912 RepID=UPI002607EEE4|nr:GGDEF domain-containing protein [Pseudonocardia sp.]